VDVAAAARRCVSSRCGQRSVDGYMRSKGHLLAINRNGVKKKKNLL